MREGEGVTAKIAELRRQAFRLSYGRPVTFPAGGGEKYGIKGTGGTRWTPRLRHRVRARSIGSDSCLFGAISGQSAAGMPQGLAAQPQAALFPGFSRSTMKPNKKHMQR